MNIQNIKVIWEPKKMTDKICKGEAIRHPWNYWSCKETRKELEGFNRLLFIAPIRREQGKKITANITVYKIPAPGEVNPRPYYGNPDYLPFEPLVHGHVEHTGKHAQFSMGKSFEMVKSFEICKNELKIYQEALDVFSYGVARFKEVFKDYLPA
jgi:hypothetical protein